MRKHFAILSFFFIATSSFAQQSVLFTQYYFNGFTYNPALTGAGNTSVFLLRRDQWRGFEGSPKLNLLSADGGLKNNKMGLGIEVFSENKGITEKIVGQLAYAYRINFSEESTLGFGISAGLINNRINFSEAIVNTPSDPFIGANSQGETAPSGNAGVNFKLKNFEAGVALRELLAPELKYSDAASGIFYKMSRNYVGSIRYKFDINTDKEISLIPLVLVRSIGGAPIQYDINAMLNWQKLGWFAVSYKSNYAVGLNAGFRIKNIHIGYAYDMVTNGLKGYSGASHEILLGYVFGKKEPKPEVKKDTEPLVEPTETEEVKRLSEEIKEKERSLKEHEAYILSLIDAFYKDGGQVADKQAEIDKIRQELDKYKKDMTDYINKLKQQLEEEKNKAN